MSRAPAYLPLRLFDQLSALQQIGSCPIFLLFLAALWLLGDYDTLITRPSFARNTDRTMINRRRFIRVGAISSVTALSVGVRAAPANPPASNAMNRGYALTNGATAKKRKDGTWVFWVRLVNFDKPGADIAANLQIATDRSFQQIVDNLPVMLTASKSFIAQVLYAPRAGSTQLYYRYVIGQDASTAPAVSGVVNSIAPWDNESRAQ
jgi:phosphodiesterase/alkaline phosphatase D-like protein